MIDLTLNSFLIGNMVSFQNAFGTKKAGTNPDGSPKGCTTQELTVNMMMPFMRARPITVTNNQETSLIEADASMILSGETTSLRLGSGAYHGVEVKIFNETAEEVELLDSDFVIPIAASDTLELRWTGVDWRVKTKYFVGDLYQQLPLTKSPVQRRWEGNWVNWTYRPTFMGLRTSPPSEGFLADWRTHRHDIWHLNTDGSVATQGTKKYGKPGGGKPDDHIIAPREAVIKLADADLAEGDVVPAGTYAGYYVWQNIALAGTFLSIDDNDPLYPGGGNRPPFNQGVAPDTARPVEGSIGCNSYMNSQNIGSDINRLFGPYYKKEDPLGTYQNTTIGTFANRYLIGFDTSLVVPTGLQNSPITAASTLWRRLPG